MYTYIISTECKQYLKIGKAKDINQRLSGLQTGSPIQLKLEGWFEGDIEKQLHIEYKGYNVRNEWFRYEVLKKIEQKSGYIIKKKEDIPRWTEENSTNVVLMYQDKLGAKEYHTATIYRKVNIGDIITMQEMGYTQKRFCEEILCGHIPSIKWDHSNLEVVEILPRWCETNINGWGYYSRHEEVEYYQSPYMNIMDCIVNQRKKLVSQYERKNKKTVIKKGKVSKKLIPERSWLNR